jgi:AAA family ATPase
MLRKYADPTLPETLRKVAQKTHGFVAEDLRKLCIVARKASTSFFNSTTTLLPGRESISQEGFDVALRKVHASITGEVFVDIPKVYWSDIGGSETVKAKLGEVINFFFGENQESLTHFDVKPTSGILLYGPPGCSKTLTAKALATESGFNFLAVKGPELISKFVGDTEYNIREVFRKARAAAPCVIFFDEIDSMAVTRGDPGGHESLNSVTALLNELDGIEELKGVLVLAATNRPGKIDKALLRPGRLGKHMYLGPPDLQARKQILSINTRNRHLADDVSLDNLAQRTESYSGADVTELCRIAAMEAFNEHLSTKGVSNKLTQTHFEAAFQEVRSGISDEMLRELEEWSITSS